MNYQDTPFRLRLAALDPAFQGTPAEFAAALVELLSIVSPDGFYGIVVSDAAPSSNIGLWLQGGTKPYVWDVNTNQYIPLELSASLTSVLAAITALQAQDTTHSSQIAALQAQDTTHTSGISALQALFAKGRVVFSATAPSADDRTKVLWVQTDESGNTVTAFKSWDSSLNVWSTIIEFPLPTAATESTVYAGVRNTSAVFSAVTSNNDFNLTLPTGMRWSDVDVMLTVAASGASSFGAVGSMKWNCGSRLDEVVTTGATTGAGFTNDFDIPADGSSATDRWVGVVPVNLQSVDPLVVRVTIERSDFLNLFFFSVSIRARAVST